MAQAGKVPPDNSLNHHCVTLPGHESKLPSSPPSTAGRLKRVSDASPQEWLQRILHAYNKRAEEVDPPSCLEFVVDHQEYDCEAVERLFRRHDYDLKRGRLTIRMPSIVHDVFVAEVANAIYEQLKSIQKREDEEREDEVGELSSKIMSGLSATIYIDEIQRDPDAQFQHAETTYPGVVVEVSYSQNGKMLQKLAQDYILNSDGEIRAVIGIDINPRGKESTISLWRARFTLQEGEQTETLDAEQEVAHMPFRSADGQPMNDKECLTLYLSDFAPREVSSGPQAVSFSIEFGKLFNFLAKSEQLRHKRQRQRSRSSRPPLKKRRLPPSSPKRL
ncbi:hypothetical protein V8C37DRAFT_383475 [Trichoderma ceciliae]